MCIQPDRIRLLRALLFCMVMVLAATGNALDAPATEPQTAVLALYGSRPDLPANVLVDEIIRSTLEQELGARLDFYAEFLDTARWPEAETQAAVRDFLRRRYAQRKLSVIIVVAQPAINFIRIYGDELFPGVPIVAYGPSDALRDWEPGRPITGTLGKIDISGTVELMLRLQPRTREILVISGASASDQWLRSIARPQLAQLEKRVKFTYLTGVAVEDLVNTVARVPDGTAILFLSMLQDSAGNNLLSQEVLARIAKHARVPIYSHGGTYLGLGSVGGVVFNPEALAHETAQRTLRVLRGERIQDLPVQESKSTVPTVDWRQLKRWGLDEKRLPAGTAVRFRESSVWEAYKWYIIGTLALILAEWGLILGLLSQRERRKKVEAELEVTYDRLRLAVEAGKCVGWDWNVKTGETRWFGDLQLIFGIPSDMLCEKAEDFRRRVCADDREFVSKAIAHARKNRTPYVGEFRIIRTDHAVRWIKASGQFYYAPNRHPVRMLGIAVDITESKMAEEALRNLTGRLIEAQDEERKRIARDIHDDYQQRLAMIAIDLEGIGEHSSAAEKMCIRELWNRVSELGGDLHSLSHQLHSSTLESLGLVAGMKAFCEEFSEQHEIQVDFAYEDIPQQIQGDVSLCFFRVVQEALRNVKKHSGANRAEVRLRYRDEKLHVSVSDRGSGFNPKVLSPRSGIGIRSMEERLRFLGGEIEIQSRPKEGTTIEAFVPFKVAVKRAG